MTVRYVNPYDSVQFGYTYIGRFLVGGGSMTGFICLSSS